MTDSTLAVPTTVPPGARALAAGGALAAATLLSVTAYAGTAFSLAAVLLLAALLAWGWPALLRLPSPRGTTAAVIAAAVMTSLSVALVADEPLLRYLPIGVAGGVLAEFVHQLARRDHRPRLAESVTGSVAAQVVVASGAALLALPHAPVAEAGVVVATVPVALGLALLGLTGPTRLVGGLALLGCVGAAAGLGAALPEVGIAAGAATGAASGVVAVCVHRLLAQLPPAGTPAGWVALAVGPLLAPAAVAFVVLRLMVA